MKAIESLILKTLLEICPPVFSQILVQAELVSQDLFTQKHPKRDLCRLTAPMGSRIRRSDCQAVPTLPLVPCPFVGVVRDLSIYRQFTPHSGLP